MTLRLFFGAAMLLAALVFVPAAAQQPPAAQPSPAQAPTTQPPSTQPPTVLTAQAQRQEAAGPCMLADVSMALPLLDRVQRVLDDAVKEAGLGKIEMDRGAIDEMRAEIAQVRAAIQPVTP